MPKEGLIDVLIITEKQFAGIITLLEKGNECNNYRRKVDRIMIELRHVMLSEPIIIKKKF